MTHVHACEWLEEQCIKKKQRAIAVSEEKKRDQKGCGEEVKAGKEKVKSRLKTS